MIKNKNIETILVLLTGIMFIGMLIAEILYVLFISNPLGSTWYSGIITNIPFLLVVIYLGLCIEKDYVSEKQYKRRILFWFFGSIVGFALINILIMITMIPDTLFGIVSWLRWSVIIGSGLGLIIGFFESRSIEKAVQAEREKICADEVEEKKNMLSYLNATLRHEVLNTASVVIGYSDHIMNEYSDDKTIKDTMNIIKTQTEDMEDVIEDVRLLLESTQENVEPIPIDLNELLNDEIENLQNANSNVKVTVDSEEKSIIKAKKPISRAFSNILWNAVEHNDSDVPRIQIKIKKDGDYIITDIKDNGPGIPKSELENLFNKEIRHDSNHGLGLTLSKTLISSYNGSLNVLNTGEDGSTFRIKLPEGSYSNK